MNITQEYFQKRKTFRTFSDLEVSPELVEKIVSLAEKAPTTGTMQLYSVIENRDPEIRKRLNALHFNQPATKAPVMLTVCADFNKFTRWCKLRNADPAYDNFLSFISAFADAIIFAQQIVTIAEGFGLGTCYLGTVTYNAPEIARILNLPDMVMPVACLAIGWPEGEAPATERLEVGSVLFHEKYPDFSDQQILDIYKVKEEYPANAKFPEENGLDNLAQVYANVRYPRQMNEEYSAKLLEWLNSSWLAKK